MKVEFNLYRCRTLAHFGVQKFQEDIFEFHILLETHIVFDEDIDQVHGFINLTATATKRVFFLPSSKVSSLTRVFDDRIDGLSNDVCLPCARIRFPPLSDDRVPE